MNRRLTSLHARTICHATEDCSRVEEALRTVTGNAPIRRSVIRGHFGNPIEVMEAVLDDERTIMELLRRMSIEDLQELESTLDARMDNSCHIFFRLDKQRAYSGTLKLSDGEDVVALRVKVRAFPAKTDVATEVMNAVLSDLMS